MAMHREAVVRLRCDKLGKRNVVEWRSGGAGALQAQGRGSKFLRDHYVLSVRQLVASLKIGLD